MQSAMWIRVYDAAEIANNWRMVPGVAERDETIPDRGLRQE